MRNDYPELNTATAQPCQVADGSVHRIRYQRAPCGNRSQWDDNSGMGWCCETCLAMVGSVGMPAKCAKIMRTDQALERLGN
jgi:hypothetical protein